MTSSARQFLQHFLPAEAPYVRRLKVTVYDGEYRRLGTVGDYLSCDVMFDDMGAGPGTLEVGDDHRLAEVLLSAHTTTVLVTVDHGVKRWSGRVDTALQDGDIGAGVVTANLVGEWRWLESILAWPMPTGTIDQQSTAESDDRTGPADDVAAAYTQAAIDRLGLPLRFTDRVTSPVLTVDLSARMTLLSDLVLEPLLDAGAVLTAGLWLPGDPQPVGMTLTGPTVLLDAREVRVQPWLRWTDTSGGVTARTVSVQAPTAYRAVVGNGNTGTDRLWVEVIDTARREQFGHFAFPDAPLVDASDLVIPDELLKPAEGETAAQRAAREAELAAAIAAMKVVMVDRGRQALAGTGPKAAISFTVRDLPTRRFGVHYDVGDVATGVISGVEVTDRITSVLVSDTRDDGLTVTPTLGRDTAAASPDQAVLDRVTAIQATLRRTARR